MKISNDLDSVSRAFEYSESFFSNLGSDTDLEDAFFSTNIVLDEIISNIIKYSETSSDIEVELSISTSFVKVVIKDEGKPFNPTLHISDLSKFKSVDDFPVGKVGIKIVKEISDNISYKREKGKNVLTIWIPLKCNNVEIEKGK